MHSPLVTLKLYTKLNNYLQPFIYFLISLAVLSLPFCVDFSLVEVRGGRYLVAVHELLIVMASLIAEHKL